MLAAMSDLIRWCAANRSEHTHTAGSLVFMDLALALEVIDRAEAAGIGVERVQGFGVDGDIATPIAGQRLDPGDGGLLDCETPSGATCGSARRALRERWVGSPPVRGRHMVLLDLDERG